MTYLDTKVFGGLIFLVLVIVLGCFVTNDRVEEVRQTLERNGYTVRTCENAVFDTGPFWLTKGTQVVRAETNRGLIYARFSWGVTWRRDDGTELELQ